MFIDFYDFSVIILNLENTRRYKYRILTGDHTVELVFSNSCDQWNFVEFPFFNKINGLFRQESFHTVNLGFHYW